MNSPRTYILHETTYKHLKEHAPNVAVLPWGATEAHGQHLPHGTDVIEATAIAIRAAEISISRGAKPVVLPAIPFGNDEQQLDQIATISFRTETAVAILRDVVRSLSKQGIDRLLIVNGHGGNEFKPMVRDISAEFDSLIVVANFWQMEKYEYDLRTKGGDHADEMETSMLLHLTHDWVDMKSAGKGLRAPFQVEGLNQTGVWTPRPWTASHADLGSGDPTHASAEKGKVYFEAVSNAVANIIIGLSRAEKGQIPYL